MNQKRQRLFQPGWSKVYSFNNNCQRLVPGSALNGFRYVQRNRVRDQQKAAANAQSQSASGHSKCQTQWRGLPTIASKTCLSIKLPESCPSQDLNKQGLSTYKSLLFKQKNEKKSMQSGNIQIFHQLGMTHEEAIGY